MLVENKVELDGRERDLNLRDVALVEAQSQGLNPRDNHYELMMFVELWKLLKEAEVECVTEVGGLPILAWDIQGHSGSWNASHPWDPLGPTHGR
jgi:hypothetical protein